MSGRTHHYATTVEWTGNRGTGTSAYTGYDRAYVISASGKAPIAGSSDAAFRGDASRWNPEDLLVASISTCHQLWYLHLCADAGVSVESYLDQAVGEMVEEAGGSGRFITVRLQPQITIRENDKLEVALRLHHEAHAKCFTANSVNFPVTCDPTITVCHKSNE